MPVLGMSLPESSHGLSGALQEVPGPTSLLASALKLVAYMDFGNLEMEEGLVLSRERFSPSSFSLSPSCLPTPLFTLQSV